MQNPVNSSTDSNPVSTGHTNLHDLTARWTSPAYSVNFGLLASIEDDDMERDIFSRSVWGVSEGLRELLSDYSDIRLRQSATWLTLQQNHMVARMLDDLAGDTSYQMPSLSTLEKLFIVIDSELFLPGLKLVVTCVTSVMLDEDEEDGITRFVALLDPGEVQQYITERQMPLNPRIQ